MLLVLGSVVEVAEGAGRRQKSPRSGRVCVATERGAGRLSLMTDDARLKGGDLSLRRGADLNYKDKWRNLKKGGPIWRGGSSSGAGPSGSHIHDLDYQPILRHLARQASAQGVSSAPIWPGLPTCSARALY